MDSKLKGELQEILETLYYEYDYNTSIIKHNKNFYRFINSLDDYNILEFNDKLLTITFPFVYVASSIEDFILKVEEILLNELNKQFPKRILR